MMEKRHGLAALRWDFDRPIQGGPIDRGFDSYFGVDLPNLPPFTFIENDRVVAPQIAPFRPDPGEGSYLPTQFAGAPAAAGWRLQDVLPQLTTRAVRHVQERARAQQPFFLYFALTSPHDPVVPSDAFRGKSGVAPIADFIMETDWAVGQVVKAIDRPASPKTRSSSSPPTTVTPATRAGSSSSPPDSSRAGRIAATRETSGRADTGCRWWFDTCHDDEEWAALTAPAFRRFTAGRRSRRPRAPRVP